VKRAVFLHKADNTVDEIVAAIVMNVAECGLAAEVIVAVGIAAGTVQGAFTGDLYREQRRVAF